MKALNKLNNREKGQILFDLFPEYKDQIIVGIKHIASHIAEHQDEVRNLMTDNGKKMPLINPNYWIALAIETDKRCTAIIKGQAEDNQIVEMLFEELAPMVAHALGNIEETDAKITDKKFFMAVNLLF